jgi:hypothetical protein
MRVALMRFVEMHIVTVMLLQCEGERWSMCACVIYNLLDNADKIGGKYGCQLG